MISPRYDVKHGELEAWVARLLPSRLVSAYHRHTGKFVRSRNSLIALRAQPPKFDVAFGRQRSALHQNAERCCQSFVLLMQCQGFKSRVQQFINFFVRCIGVKLEEIQSVLLMCSLESLS